MADDAGDLLDANFWKEIGATVLTTLLVTAAKGVVAIILGGIVFLIGWIIIKIIMSIVRKILAAKSMTEEARGFILSMVKGMLYLILVLVILDVLNIEALGVGMLVASLALAVGSAVSGMAVNFIAGLMCIFMKPIKKGELIETQGVMGVVTEVEPLKTTLLSLDNATIYVANGPIMMDPLINYNRAGKRRVDLTIGIDYNDDIKTAKKILNKLMKSHKLVLKSPAPTCEVIELADSSVNLCVRPWAECKDYWRVYFDLTESAKVQLEAAGLSFPFPQRDVHYIKAGASPSKADAESEESEEESEEEEEEEPEPEPKKSKKGKKGKK